METHELMRYLKVEIEFRKEQITSGIRCQSSELPARYNYELGFLDALIQTQFWLKDHEAKKMNADLEE